MAFFKACWEVIKEDVMKSVDYFYNKGFLDKESNTTFISLIPKKEGWLQLMILDLLVWLVVFIK